MYGLPHSHPPFSLGLSDRTNSREYFPKSNVGTCTAQAQYGVSPIYHLLAHVYPFCMSVYSFAASLTSPIFSLGAYFFRTDSLWYYITKKD